MAVFRRKLVFRDSRETGLLGSQSIVSAGFSAAVAVGATLSGATPGSAGELTASVSVGFAPIETISLEVSVPQAVVVSTTMSGLNVSLGALVAPVSVSASQRNDALFQPQVIAACTMTVGSIFTMDSTPQVVVSATFDPASTSVGVSCPAIVTAAFPSGVLSGGTVEVSTSGAISVSASFTANTGNAFSSPVMVGATFAATRIIHYVTPRERCVVIRPERGRV